MKVAWCGVARRVLRIAASHIRDCRSCPGGLTGDPCASEVVGASDGPKSGPHAGAMKSRAPRASLIVAAVAEPEVGSPTVEMMKALPEEEARFYEEESNVRITSGISTVILDELTEIYCFVGGPRDEYIKYYHRREVRPLWQWIPASTVKAYAGFSVVAKKDSSKQRKILMCVPANYLLGTPKDRADHGLFGGGALAGLSVDGGRWAVAAFEESNAFTAVTVPSWLTRYQCAPPLRASEVWSLPPKELHTSLQPWSWVAPSYLRLAMGSSHSVHILMAINLRAIGVSLVAGAGLTKMGSSMPLSSTRISGLQV